MAQSTERTPAFSPVFSRWRHGGWYVSNVIYPNGACGCVSNKFPDRKWRIVCDDRRKELGGEGDITYPSRHAAAVAEHLIATAQQAKDDETTTGSPA